MSSSALQASAYLHHLHFSSPHPEKIAKWYGDVMDMKTEQLPEDEILRIARNGAQPN